MEKSELCIDVATVSCMEKLKVESEWTMLETRGVTLKNQKHRFFKRCFSYFSNPYPRNPVFSLPGR